MGPQWARDPASPAAIAISSTDTAKITILVTSQPADTDAPVLTDVAVTPDGRNVLTTGGSGDYALRLWQLGTSRGPST